MKANKNYFPRTDLGDLEWLGNFDAEFSVVATLLGFTAADVTAVHNDYLAYKYGYETSVVFRSYASERRHFKDLLHDGPIGTPANVPVVPTLPAVPSVLIAGIFPRIAKLVEKIKVSSNYTRAIGAKLRIVAPDSEVDFDTVKPKITKIVNSDFMIKLYWTKSKMHGVVIYGAITNLNTPDESIPALQWIEIGRDFSSPYDDTRKNKTGKPELRIYKFRYLYKDEVVGLETDFIKVVAEIF